MFVRELTFDGFRNLHPGRWEPSGDVNILYGDNAQGKTNVLEACWLFTGGRSFRGAKDAEMVQFDREQARLSMQFYAGHREQEATVTIKGRRQATLNGVALPTAAKLAGTFCGVVFSPDHLSLIKDGPEGRRRFIDAAICQLKPGYIATLSEYQKTLAQRNAFLKQSRVQYSDTPTQAQEMLELWNYTLAVNGTKITRARQQYVRRLAPVAREIYHGLTRGKETIHLTLDTPAGAETVEETARHWQRLFHDSLQADLAAGFTTVGPHREDLQITIDGNPVKNYGSQGQTRSAVLALKLAEARLLQEILDEPPVLFLDDVMSELDLSRQDYLLNHIEGWQVFITCCEPSPALKNTAAKVFSVKQGVISE